MSYTDSSGYLLDQIFGAIDWFSGQLSNVLDNYVQPNLVPAMLTGVFILAGGGPVGFGKFWWAAGATAGGAAASAVLAYYSGASNFEIASSVIKSLIFANMIGEKLIGDIETTTAVSLGAGSLEAMAADQDGGRAFWNGVVSAGITLGVVSASQKAADILVPIKPSSVDEILNYERGISNIIKDVLTSFQKDNSNFRKVSDENGPEVPITIVHPKDLYDYLNFKDAAIAAKKIVDREILFLLGKVVFTPQMRGSEIHKVTYYVLAFRFPGVWSREVRYVKGFWVDTKGFPRGSSIADFVNFVNGDKILPNFVVELKTGNEILKHEQYMKYLRNLPEGTRLYCYNVDKNHGCY